MYSAIDFIYVEKAGFVETYRIIQRAMRNYITDAHTCCMVFRQAVESAIKDAHRIMPFKLTRKLEVNIRRLGNSVPASLGRDLVVSQMNVIRRIANQYVHLSVENRDVRKDCQSCYLAMQKISRWLVDFKEAYPRYQREQGRLNRKRLETTTTTPFSTLAKQVGRGFLHFATVLGLKSDGGKKKG